MKIDLTCPVELWQYAMPTETDAECTFVMNNLSDKVVTSVQVTLNCFARNGELLFRQTERIQGLKAGVGERFSVVVLPSEWQGVEGVDLVIEKVWFDDATIWRKGNAQLADYQPNALPAGRALDELRFVAGKDAVGYPQMQEEAWLCICGRPNVHASQRCCRCQRRRDAVFASFSRENVTHLIAAHEQKLAETARKAREENNILQENREKKQVARRRRRKNTVRWTAALMIAAVAAAIACAWLLPMVRYNTAADLLAEGHFDEAREAFSRMGDYRDAAAQALESDYQKAEALCEEGGVENLAQAEELFISLGEYQDSAERSLQTAYDLGALCLQQGLYEQAVEKFQQLGDYQDSAEKRKESIYQQAAALLEAQSFDAARILFAGLGDYSDAHDMTKECNYRMAEAKLAEGDYQGALAIWNLLGNYADTQERIGECYYALAQQQMQAENYEAAGEWFLMAGEYSDAQTRANECFYQLAQAQLAAGEYDRALTLFMRTPEYRDCIAMAQQCVYQKAEKLAAEGGLVEAAVLFESISGYNDAQARLDSCRYQLAQNALAEEKLEEAEALMALIMDENSVADELKSLRYKIAEQKLKEHEYQSALERYEQLGAYKDSRAKVKRCRYELAKAAMEAGEYEEAAEAFKGLGSYRDSKTLLARARKLQETAEAPVTDAAVQETPAETAGQTLSDEETLPEASEAQPEETGENEIQPEEETGYAETARAAMKRKDYAAVTETLWDMDFEALPEEEQDLEAIFLEACVEYGDQLYTDGRPYEAIDYYYRADAQTKLTRKAYLVLGDWESVTGKTASFRRDGTCTLMGEELYFRVSNLVLYTGTSPDDMSATHKMSVLTKTGMSLYDQRGDKDVLYKMSRVGDFAPPQPEQLPATEDGDASNE